MTGQFSIKDNQPWKARFFTIWGGQALSILGSQLVQFALIWYLTVSTGSATVLATASLAGMLPAVVLGPIAGALVDRCSRRWIMVLADGITALATLVLALLFALDAAAIWHIYVVMFVRSMATSFHSTAMTASTSLMVPVEKLTRVQGVNQMLTGSLNIIAAPLGALLLGVLPIQGILAIDVLTAALAILPLLFIAVPQPARAALVSKTGEPQPGVLQDFKAGLHYMINWPGLLLIGLILVGINFTILPAFSLLPLLVSEYFGGGALQLAWIESAMGIGIVLGGALLGVWGGFERRMLTSMTGLMGIGAGALLLALAPAAFFPMAVGGVLLTGMMISMTNGPFIAVIQSVVSPDMQARVISLLVSLGTAMTPLGLMIAGPVADRVGIQAWFLAGGLLCILMAAAGLCIPAVMDIENRHGPIAETLNMVSEQAA